MVNQAACRRLRQILSGPGTTPIAGAHDALSARLVQEAGYEAVWASSFGVSLAAHCLPDADLLSMTQCLDAARRMAGGVHVPVLADANAGFGGAVNVMRTVRELESAGVAGICVEDSPCPRRVSLHGYRDAEPSLAPQTGLKVRAACGARRTREFVVVARVESLIAGEGVDMALRRADAYAQAGADALLVHGRGLADLRRFTERWTGGLPLVAVPTLYPEVSLAELGRSGFRAAIFPNQAVRAALRAMREVLRTMLRTGTCGSVEPRIATLAEIDRLVELDGTCVAPEPLALAPPGRRPAGRARRAPDPPEGDLGQPTR